jgi:predicted hotdog family 3-hydroxylacyl-ACP dehydratase
MAEVAAQLDKAEIRRLIPHSGTMCLLDEVVTWNERTIVCLTMTHRDATNPLRRAGRLSSVHAFEYGAQAAAIHGGVRARAAGTTAPPGYLAAVREAVLEVDAIDNIDGSLRVEAERLFGEAADSVYQCRILAGEKLLAHGRVTIIRRA